jgi:hypothetical protein
MKHYNPVFNIGEIVIVTILRMKGIVRAHEVITQDTIFYHVMMANGEISSFSKYELMSLEDYKAYELINGNQELD